ncbi:hypothetical protein HCA69_06765 [Listeria grandensis]|uniref:Uncharacterized protein n=1 Tax=Listeria grandensis TaxID=1494963 RepID=A0A7X0Y3G9_9LIST|nr:hypothetical protein [Listeria grandensis]MBC1936063.1 hypothetical protein [Listeria grandensis]
MKKWYVILIAAFSVVFVMCLFVFSDTPKAEDTTARLNVASLGSYELDTNHFHMENVEGKDVRLGKLRSYDALLITKDYIYQTDQKALKKKLNKVDIPLLFADFEEESSIAFLTTELPLSEAKMAGKGTIQMAFTLPNHELATFSIFDTSRESLDQLNKAIQLVQRVKNLEEWETRSVKTF